MRGLIKNMVMRGVPTSVICSVMALLFRPGIRGWEGHGKGIHTTELMNIGENEEVTKAK